MNNQHSSEKSIFLSAIEIASASERAAYLDSACAGNQPLRSEIEALVAAHHKPLPLLDAPSASSPTMIEPPHETAGTVIGPYKLLEQIGEGGFGVVFMAEQQQPLRRKVALKVIKAGMDTRQVIARFEAERQALALMDHPNIAKVLDAGATASGRPFFVMELVRGVPITAYCDEAHLNPRERLELFVHVCHAVQHAHQKGIIHRDIKPSNVLITLHDGKPTVKVIDFGIAKATGQQLTDKTLFTNFAQMVGTPLYMSPEQAGAGLDIDTRSDIYGLGVLLYELLTGSTPFDKERLKSAAFEEIRRIIREEEPPRPSTRLSGSATLASIAALCKMEPKRLSHLFRGEVDWIVMKALEKDRSRRYETASGFAMDVKRYLNDEAVEACPPSAAYRFRKFAMRNKQSLSMAAVVAVAVLIAVATLGWSVRDRGAREEKIEQEAARRLATSELGITQAIDRAAASRTELQAILNRPGGVQSLLNHPGRWELLIKTAQGELARAVQLATDADPKVSESSTRAIEELEVQVSRDQADYELAQQLEDIRASSEIMVDNHFDLRGLSAKYPKAFAGFAVLTEEPVASAARLRASPVRAQLVAGLDHWAYIAFRARDHTLTQRLHAVARLAAPDPLWGDRLRQIALWRDPKAVAALVADAPIADLSPQVLDLVAYLIRTDDPLSESWLRRAQAAHPSDFWLSFKLGRVLFDLQSLVEAAVFFRVAIAVRPNNMLAYDHLGYTLMKQKKCVEARDAYRKAIEIDPMNAGLWTNLGTTFERDDTEAQAIAAFRKAIEIDPSYALAHHNLASSLRNEGQLDAAIVSYREAVRLAPDKHDTRYMFAHALRQNGAIDESIAEYRELIRRQPDYVAAHEQLGHALKSKKRLDEAIVSYRRAIELMPTLPHAHCCLGDCLRDTGDLDGALAAYEESARIAPKDATHHERLGYARFMKKDLTGAAGAYRAALDRDPKSIWAQNALAGVLMDLGKAEEAIIAYRDLIRLQPDNPFAHYRLGFLLKQQDQWREALAALEDANKLRPDDLWTLILMAKVLTIAPEPELRDTNRALRLAAKAVDVGPDSAAAWQTLGWARYRAGDWQAGIDALEKSCKLQSNGTGDADQWLFMAMAHEKLGRHEEALKWYEKSKSFESVRPKELERLRAEAAKLLGVKEE